jgi:aminoglycoside phosphotransferase family enzyme/predicted kinase
MEQGNVIAFLSDPASYGIAGAVERHETHGAIVFLAGDFAYKLKRAVRFPYMDYSTPERRRAACAAELAVNRRMAPSLYIGVRSIREANGRLRFGEADDPQALDWVVAMKRFPQSALLEQMRRKGQLTDAIMRKLADAIAVFHMCAEATRTFVGAAGIAEVVEGNISVLTSFRHKPFAEEKIAAYAAASRAAVKTMAARLDARRDAGFVRHCHGDLHLNNVCMLEDEPVLFDAIEFNEAFSHIDVFYDLAFLLMDLEHGGDGRFANTVLNRYLECTGDFGGLALLPLLLSCRAAVRAHVKAAQAKGDGNVEKEALSYLEDAIRFLEPAPPRLIVLGGVSGTGKSTLGRALAPMIGAAPGAVMLRSDVLRKSLWNVSDKMALPDAAYTADVTREVYDVLRSRAEGILAQGHSVIADAVYGTSEERKGIADMARRMGVSFQPIWLDAPLAILERRVAARRNDASDATVAILHRQRAAVTPPMDWINVDAGGTPEDTVRRTCAALGMKGSENDALPGQ